MCLCVGALKEFFDKAGGSLQRPLDHARANDQGVPPPPPPSDHVLAYRISEVLCKSHTAYMTRYTARAAQEPKGRSPYGSLEEARGALGSDFNWKNVHFKDVVGVLSWQTRAGEWIPMESKPSANCRRCVQKGAALPAKHWHFQCPIGAENRQWGGGVSGALLHATTGVGAGNQIASVEGCECPFRWIWSRWCMLGNEDEPSGPDAWAARSWRAGTRRAYAQKLAKIAEFQEASGETSMAWVLGGSRRETIHAAWIQCGGASR